MSYSCPSASTPMILGVGKSRVADRIGIARTGHEENGHMLRCVRPGTKLMIKAKRRKAFVSRRLAAEANTLPETETPKPNTTKARKQMALATFVFKFRPLAGGGWHPQVGSTRLGNADSNRKRQDVVRLLHKGNRPACNL